MLDCCSRWRMTFSSIIVRSSNHLILCQENCTFAKFNTTIVAALSNFTDRALLKLRSNPFPDGDPGPPSSVSMWQDLLRDVDPGMMRFQVANAALMLRMRQRRQQNTASLA
jgi:hypothetical protein